MARTRAPRRVRKAKVAPLPPPELTGDGGKIFQSPGHIRADARLAARLISLGVVQEDQAKAILEAGFSLAARAASANKPREWARCLEVFIRAANLEHQLRPQQVEHLHLHTGQVDYTVALEQMTDEELRLLSKLEGKGDPNGTQTKD